jgi:hypothetical protein
LFVTALDVLHDVVGHPDRPHEAGIDQFGHCTPGLLERHTGTVGPMQEVDIDLVAPEPTQAVRQAW